MYNFISYTDFGIINSQRIKSKHSVTHSMNVNCKERKIENAKGGNF